MKKRASKTKITDLHTDLKKITDKIKSVVGNKIFERVKNVEYRQN
jgi:hypothetical protein